MPRSSNQKQKLFKLAEIFRTETNEDHPITISRLIELLENKGIEAERKSLYDDIEVLSQCGIEIEKTGASRNTSYYYAGGDFELQELKLLADAVACSKFITEKKSNDLISKLSSLTNRYDADELKRTVIVADRVKNENEHIYYNIDRIQQAIRENKKIRFLYFDYDCRQNKIYHNEGAYSEVSPYALCWSEEKYYLVGYYEKYKGVSNFRADKIEGAEVLPEKRVEPPKSFNLSEYTEKRFGMFSGKETSVTLRVHNSLSGVIFDRFGKDIPVLYFGDYFQICVNVVASPIFFGWVFQFGEKMEITKPENVRNDFKDYVKKVYNLYK